MLQRYSDYVFFFLSMAKKTVILLVVGTLAVIGLFFAVMYSLSGGFVEEMAWQTRYVPNIEQALGLQVSTPYVDGQEVRQYFVVPNLYAYERGIRTDDILIQHPDDSYTGDIFRAIYEARNDTGSVTFHVRRGNEIVKIHFDQIPDIGEGCIKSPTTTVTGDTSRSFDQAVIRAGGCPL